MKTTIFRTLSCLAALGIFLSLYSGSDVLAQGVAIQYEIRFVEKQETYYFRTDQDWEPSQLDLLKLMPIIVRDSVVKQVFTTNDMKTTIYHLENSQSEEWMDMPVRTVMDRNKLRAYGAGNELMLDIGNSDTYMDTYNKLKDTLTLTGGDIIPDFPKLTNKLKNEFLFNGYSMSNLGGGSIQFTKDSLITIINNKKLTIDQMIKDIEGNTVYYEKRGFLINILGQTVPSFSLVRKQDSRFSPGLVYQIDVTTYQDYWVDHGEGFKMGDAVEESLVLIYPNPVGDEVHIIWDSPLEEIVNVRLLDQSGTSVYNATLQGIQKLDIDLSDKPSGMYILLIYHGAECTQEKIIKL